MVGSLWTLSVFPPMPRLPTLLLLNSLDPESGSFLYVLLTITQSTSHNVKDAAIKDLAAECLINIIETKLYIWECEEIQTYFYAIEMKGVF